MLRKLGRDDFARTIERAIQEDRDLPFRWCVYESYKLIGDDPQSAFFRAPNQTELRKVYEPLTDTPYLFLEFARLQEHDDRGQAIKDWIARYGLLGLHLRDPRWLEAGPPTGSPYWRFFRFGDWRGDSHEYDARGGPGETLASVEHEVRYANLVLTYWEAALSGDWEQIDQALFAGSYQHDIERFAHRTTAADLRHIHADVLTTGARVACFLVQSVLEAFAYPSLSFDSDAIWKQKESAGDAVIQVSRYWHPRNLLGAIYLQMYWLMTSSGEMARCEYCGRILPLTRPHPEGRKHRSDKRFCNDACRMASHRREKKRQASGF